MYISLETEPVMSAFRLKLTLFLTMLSSLGFAQLTGTGCVGSTSYTNGMPDDNIYYYPAGSLGSLTATPSSGTPGWTFIWSSFSVGNNSWTAFQTQTNVPSSTISNLSPGAYGVTIFDGTNTAVGCYHAWISQIVSEPSVDVAPIAPGCSGPVFLNGTINGGAVSPYSNLPLSQMLIDANTQVSICFSGNHTWVSDLAFHVIGPSSCGSPNLTLLPNPGSIGQGSVCNSGDNINNLCFSTESTNNINVCSPAPATLSGTYGSYGLSNTPISWGSLYGCDASNGGWSVQIYDCIGGDIGSLTDATLTFTGTDACGNPQTISYTTPPGYNSPIADLSCSSGSASIFTVAAAPAPLPIACQFGYEWSSVPYVYIADSTTSLNIQLDNLVDASGNPMPWQTIAFTLSITNSCDSIGGENGCFGGNSSDTEIFSFIPAQSAYIEPVAPVCVSSGPFGLISNIPGGTWSGPGIVDPGNGIFDPSSVGPGDYTIDYMVYDPCVSPGSTVISVVDQPFINLNFPIGMCIDAAPVALSLYASMAGVFNGDGITDSNTGIFDPQLAGAGIHVISVSLAGICPAFASAPIEVYALPVVDAGAGANICPEIPFGLGASGAQNYAWSPATFLNDVTIQNPTATITTNITYNVVGTDIHGCADNDQITLTVLPGPELSVNTVSIVCPGTVIQLEATGSAGNYSWTPASSITGANSQIATASPNSTTTYTVTLTDGCNIQISETVIVPVEQMYTVNAGPNLIYCEGESVEIVGTIVGADPIYHWSTTNGLINGSDASLTINVNTPGNYNLEVTTPVGCSYSDQVLVSETPLPVLSIADSAHVCPSGTVVLHAGFNWDSVLWSTGETTPDITVDHAGTFGITVTDNNCSSNGSIEVMQVVLPYINLGSDIQICQGDEAMIEAGYIGNWSTGATNSSILVSSAGTYGFTYHIENCSTSDSISVFVHPLPFLDLSPTAIGCIDQSYTIYAEQSVNAGYLWNTGETTPAITVWMPDFYYVTAFNDCGSVTDFVDVSFEDCSYSIYIPNSFTPDNDGVNDAWKISTFNVTELELYIFNRWGDVLFSTKDLQATWTGSVNNGEYFAPDGVYMYRVKFTTDTKDVIERTGNITIIR